MISTVATLTTASAQFHPAERNSIVLLLPSILSPSSKIYLGNFRNFASFSRYQSLHQWQRSTNPQILTVICCIHHPTYPMSKIPFPILNFLDSDVCAVMTLIFLTNLKKCAIFFEKRGYPASVIQAAHHRAQQIDRQSALQTSQNVTEFHSPSHLKR